MDQYHTLGNFLVMVVSFLVTSQNSVKLLKIVVQLADNMT